MKMTERLAVNVLFGFGVNGLLSAVHRRPVPFIFSKRRMPSQIFDDRYDDDGGPKWPEKYDDKGGEGGQPIDDAIPPVCWVAGS
jgi:hypothetical protein